MAESLITKTLIGNNIVLEPIVSDHYEALKRAANDERIWTYMPMKAYGPFFDDWFADSLAQHLRRTQLTYSICSLNKNDVLGCIAYYDIDTHHKRVEIGYGWITPGVWGTAFMHEAIYLLLKNAFEKEGFNRIQIATDPSNRRSYNILNKLGAVKEGLLRQHMIHHNGCVTDTILFSILAHEWLAVKIKLESRLKRLHKPKDQIII